MAEQNNEQKGPAASADPFSKQALHERSKRQPPIHIEKVVFKMEQEVLAGADLEQTVIIIPTAMLIDDSLIPSERVAARWIKRVIAHWNKLHPDVHATHVRDHVVRLDWT
jgi:hypothetical protein